VLNSSKLLPVSSNQRTNAYLKEIGDICGIKTVLTFHIARHSFATSVAFLWAKFETLSKVMGHTNLNMTLHYAKIETKLISDVDVFKDNLEKESNSVDDNIE
jgi:integrase